MSASTYKAALVIIAASFTLFFAITVVPPLLQNFDLLGAITSGFVNPYASGYSTDVIMCWCVLAVWVIYEAKTHSVKHGWICLALGAVPGVAVGFPLYLLLRHRHFNPAATSTSQNPENA
jgi:hypothetical protein